MDKIVINKKSGGSYQLLSYTGVYGVTEGTQKIDLMGQDILNIVVKSATKIDFIIGDYIEIFGKRYKLNQLPALDKISDREFDYTLTFDGIMYDLNKAQFLNLDLISDFSLMGNLELQANLIVKNLVRVFGTDSWEVGIIAATDTRNIQHQTGNCLLALQNLCNEFDQEFYIERIGTERYKLNILKETTVLPYTFRYGRGNGLYTLNRKNVDNKSIITRLWAYGGKRNILPSYQNGAPRLILQSGTGYIEQNTNLYGVREGSIIFDEIFPERTGTVSGVAGMLSFSDSSLNFNVNNQLLPGVVAKVSFKTGNLAGYEFEIISVTGNTFLLKQYQDENGLIFPSTAFNIAVGDHYTLLNINLPPSYITDAENRLLLKASDYLYENSQPNMQYGLTFDRFFIEGKDILFDVGKHVKVQDSDIELNDTIQIISVARDLIDIYKYDIELGVKVKNRLLELSYKMRSFEGVLIVNNITSQALNPTTNIQSTTINTNNLQYAQMAW